MSLGLPQIQPWAVFFNRVAVSRRDVPLFPNGFKSPRPKEGLPPAAVWERPGTTDAEHDFPTHVGRAAIYQAQNPHSGWNAARSAAGSSRSLGLPILVMRLSKADDPGMEPVHLELSVVD